MATNDSRSCRATPPGAERDLQEWLLGRLSFLVRQIEPQVPGQSRSAVRLNRIMSGHPFCLRSAIRAIQKAIQTDLQQPSMPKQPGDAFDDLCKDIDVAFPFRPIVVNKLGASYVLGEEHQRSLPPPGLAPTPPSR